MAAENQLQPLQEAARRLGWTVVTILRDDGVSGARGRQKPRKATIPTTLEYPSHRRLVLIPS